MGQIGGCIHNFTLPDLVIPKIKFSLRAISALGLDKKDFSTLEKVSTYCDSISEPLQYIPGYLFFRNIFLKETFVVKSFGSIFSIEISQQYL